MERVSSKLETISAILGHLKSFQLSESSEFMIGEVHDRVCQITGQASSLSLPDNSSIKVICLCGSETGKMIALAHIVGGLQEIGGGVLLTGEGNLEEWKFSDQLELVNTRALTRGHSAGKNLIGVIGPEKLSLSDWDRLLGSIPSDSILILVEVESIPGSVFQHLRRSGVMAELSLGSRQEVQPHYPVRQEQVRGNMPQMSLFG